MAENNIRVKLSNVRLSYPHLFQKHAYEDGVPKYQASFLIDPGTKSGAKNIQAIEAAIESAKKAVWPGKLPKFDPKKICLKDGDEEKEESEGMMVLTSGNKKRPRIRDLDGRTDLGEDDGRPYGGCYVNAIVTIYGFEKWKGVFATLEGVQFLKDGEPFGPPDLSEDAFEDLSDDDDEAAPPVKKKKRPVEEDDDEADEAAPPVKKKKRPVEEDDDGI